MDMKAGSEQTAADVRQNWKIRWLLLDAWMNLLYLMVFLAIAFLWRPTGDNRR